MSLVYGIYFNEESYVGSTMDFNTRKNKHKSACYNVNHIGYNCKLYKTIREHNINWDDIEWFILQSYPEIDNECDLKKFEQLWMDRIKPTLNSQKAHTGIESGLTREEYNKQHYQNNKEKILEYNKQYYKQYYQNNKQYLSEKVECECGSVVSRNNITRHKKSVKHINFVNT